MSYSTCTHTDRSPVGIVPYLYLLYVIATWEHEQLPLPSVVTLWLTLDNGLLHMETSARTHRSLVEPNVSRLGREARPSETHHKIFTVGFVHSTSSTAHTKSRPPSVRIRQRTDEMAPKSE